MLITPNEVVAWFSDIALWRIGRALAQSGQRRGVNTAPPRSTYSEVYRGELLGFCNV